MTRAPSTRHAVPSGTREFISRGYLSCRIWIYAWKQSVRPASRVITVDSIFSSTISTWIAIPTRAFCWATPSAATPAPSKVERATGSQVEPGLRQVIARIKAATAFLPGGGTITDGFVNSSFAINRHWTAQVFTQYERFLDSVLHEGFAAQYQRLASDHVESGASRFVISRMSA